MGPHAHLLMTSGDEGSRAAYLLGLRFGLEHRFTPSAGGPVLGAFAELGYGHFELESNRGGSHNTAENGLYGSAGLRAGYGFQSVGTLALDAALGAPIGTPGTIGIGPQPPQTRTGWRQLGLTAVLRFQAEGNAPRWAAQQG